MLPRTHQSLSPSCTIFYCNIKGKFLLRERNSLAFQTSENCKYEGCNRLGRSRSPTCYSAQMKSGQFKGSSLVLAGRELTFFTGVYTGLCFGCVLKVSRVTQGCFQLTLTSARTVLRPLLLLALPCQRVGRGTSGWVEGR